MIMILIVDKLTTGGRLPPLLLIGAWAVCGSHLQALADSHKVIHLCPYDLTSLRECLRSRPAMAMVAVTDAQFLHRVAEALEGLPWLAWVRDGGAETVRAAVAAGAVTTLSSDVDPATLVAALRNAEDAVAAKAGPRAVLRRRTRAESVVVPPGWVATVVRGVVATTARHACGTEVLLGLSGPGRLLLPPDPAAVAPAAYTAQTDACVVLKRWDDVVAEDSFVADLRAELVGARRWSAARSVPCLDERLLEVLRVLEQDFGAPGAVESVIDVRVTHAQLAMAAGASRAAVTRILNHLQSRDRLCSVGSGERRRYGFRRRGACVAPAEDNAPRANW